MLEEYNYKAIWIISVACAYTVSYFG